MSDKELVKQLRERGGRIPTEAADRIEALTAKVKLMDDLDVINGEKIEALTAKLAKAVDWFETIRDRAKGDYMAHTYYLDALAALATIKRREP